MVLMIEQEAQPAGIAAFRIIYVRVGTDRGGVVVVPGGEAVPEGQDYLVLGAIVFEQEGQVKSLLGLAGKGRETHTKDSEYG